MRVLICPLDWGLGHASRCIPLIKGFLAAEARVIIASSGPAGQLLKQQFPNLTYYNLPAYGVRYPTRSALFNFILFAPKVTFAALLEHFQVRKIIRQENIDLLISDNRLGCWSKQVRSAYVSHQLQFAFRQKWLNYLAGWGHYFWYKQYDELWIPDLAPPHQLTGKLAQPFRKKPTRYLGLLSQLEIKKEAVKYEAIVVLSGPEPQRSLLEKKILTQLQNQPGKFLLVRGLPNTTIPIQLENPSVEIVNFLGAQALSKKIAASKFVVCRSGYSSIMDLIYLNKKAILIPTPGQPEQEYLAQYHAGHPLFQMAQQDTLNLGQLLPKLKESPLSESGQIDQKNHLDNIIKAIVLKSQE